MPNDSQDRRRIEAARLYFETLRRMHPDSEILESLERQEREVDQREQALPQATPRHRREAQPA